MAKRKPQTSPSAAAEAAPAERSSIRYIGPEGQTSPVFGALIVDHIYSADADFAAYLAATHPDYWQAAPAEE